jgi:hypothetical protein
MAYIGEWERLRDALTRVIEASGSSEEEARVDICRALADGAIEIRAKPLMHATNGFVAAKMVLTGSALQIPPELQSKNLDWEGSCTKEPWLALCGGFKRPGYWHLERIELSKRDVTTVLCGAKIPVEATGWASPETAATDAGRAAASRFEVPVPAPKLAGRKSIRSPASTAALERRRRGRRPEKFERTRDAMIKDIREGRLTVAALNEMFEKQLKARYGVSRDVARRARDAVLSELAERL